MTYVTIASLPLPNSIPSRKQHKSSQSLPSQPYHVTLFTHTNQEIKLSLNSEPSIIQSLSLFTTTISHFSKIHSKLHSTMSNDTLDKLVVFLAKRDGIDKLVKTFQYVSKLAHYTYSSTRPDLADRAKIWEVGSGLSRKAFRTGRFLTGFNALRRSPGPTPTHRFLAVFANAGEMVYFFFDHFLWLARLGVIDEKLGRRMSFISAFGESVGYVFFIILDFIAIRKGLKEKVGDDDEKRRVEIIGDRVMRLMAVAANVADLVIAVADIEPNPFCCHAVTLGVSGLVSAWAGWYRNWPL